MFVEATRCASKSSFLILCLCNARGTPRAGGGGFPPAEMFSVTFDGVMVAPGEEQTHCVLKRLHNPEAMHVDRIENHLGSGSHHLIVYTSSATVEQSTPFVCKPFADLLKPEQGVPLLDGELNTLGYPRAALLGFAMALVSYNLISTTKSAMRAAFGPEKVEEEVSNYSIANEARVMKEGLDVVTDLEDWEPFQTVSAESLAQDLVELARNIRLSAPLR